MPFKTRSARSHLSFIPSLIAPLLSYITPPRSANPIAVRLFLHVARPEFLAPSLLMFSPVQTTLPIVISVAGQCLKSHPPILITEHLARRSKTHGSAAMSRIAGFTSGIPLFAPDGCLQYEFVIKRSLRVWRFNIA